MSKNRQTVDWPPYWYPNGWSHSIDALGYYVIAKESVQRCPNISKWPRRYQGLLMSHLFDILGWSGFKRLRQPEGIRFLKLLDSLSRKDLDDWQAMQRAKYEKQAQ